MLTIFSWFKRMGIAGLVLIQALSWSVMSVKAQTTLTFAGRTWLVKSGDDGPGPNHWSDASNAVFVDARGRLHLKIKQKNGVWYSSEVSLPNSLGYGTYRFDIDSSISTIDPNVVVAPFLYQDDAHEIDMEFSNWQSPGDQMGEYVVQPFATQGNMTRFGVPLGKSPSRHSIQWTPTQLVFSSSENGTIFKQWTYTGASLFAPGQETVHINHWLIDGVAPVNLREQELIIKSFTFTPTSITSAPTTTLKTRSKR